jgi:16S rRNA (cytidine1402-2'-O)-methyltransferase
VLYLVPTPIGNLEDITLRALRILKEVDVILAEDTRTTGILLKHFDISKPLQSYHIFNEHHTVTKILERLKKGENIALVSDAGTPSISDPGFLLVRACVEAGIEVNCLPGATAFVPALVQSGLPSDKFVFDGFLPHKKGKQTRLKELSEEERTVICYESPHRLLKTLEQMIPFFGAERRCSVSRELSKMFQETYNGTIEDALAYFTQKGVKGEIVIVIAPKEAVKKQKEYNQ